MNMDRARDWFNFLLISSVVISMACVAPTTGQWPQWAGAPGIGKVAALVAVYILVFYSAVWLIIAQVHPAVILLAVCSVFGGALLVSTNGKATLFFWLFVAHNILAALIMGLAMIKETRLERAKRIDAKKTDGEILQAIINQTKN